MIGGVNLACDCGSNVNIGNQHDEFMSNKGNGSCSTSITHIIYPDVCYLYFLNNMHYQLRYL